MAPDVDIQQFTIEKLIEAGHIDAAAKLARQVGKQSPDPGAATGPAAAAAAPGPDGLTEGVDYWSHADLSAMDGATMQRVIETERPKLEESMRHLTTSTRGRTYRGG